MATYIRGSNPIWLLADLVGNLFDDTFYLFVLENQIPYQPETVYHDPLGNVPWTQPIEFLANGTLPPDIFFNPDVVYRLEFREGPTDSDPLIYEINNYVPGGGGDIPVDTFGLFSENQITMPQFSIVSFSEPFALSSVTDQIIEVSPGWVLELEGTGNVVLERTPLNDSLANPTNAPYALHIVLSGGFTSCILRQRFNQNGMLWANKYVSSSVTARIDGAPQSISARLVDSLDQVLTQVLPLTSVNDQFNEYKSYGLMPDTSNTDLPPDAFIEYQLILPTDVDIYLTSFQLIESNIPFQFEYEQDTIERQNDHTFHYYQNDLIIKPKDTILTAWNFSLNPFQFNPVAVTIQPTQTAYIADQTIMHQIAVGGTLASGQATVADRQCLLVKAVNGFFFNRFALIQYIDPSTIRPYWGYYLSSLVRARIFTTHGTEVGIKMRLIYSDSLPANISPTEPIDSWTGINPTFSADWTEIIPKNDPIYILPNDYATDEGNGAFPYFSFDAFQLPEATTANQTLGIVIYTTDDLDSSAGTEDSIAFDRISLVPNFFAVDSNPQTFDQVIRQCQFFYEKSYNQGVLPGSVNNEGFISLMQGVNNNPPTNCAIRLTNISLNYNEIKRVPLSSPTRVALYSPTTGAQGAVAGVLFNGAASINSGDISAANYSVFQIGQKSLCYTANTGGNFLNALGSYTTPWSLINFHYVLDARLGTGI